jgi:hypothetical protein
MTRFVTCALETIRRHNVAPEQIDFAILCAINATLCIRSNGDDRVAEGFNSDIAINGNRFSHDLMTEAARVPKPFPPSPKRFAYCTVLEKIRDVLEEAPQPKPRPLPARSNDAVASSSDLSFLRPSVARDEPRLVILSNRERRGSP